MTGRKHKRMIRHKMNCPFFFFFKVVTELSTVVYIASVRKAANTVQNLASEHPARENPVSREYCTIGTSLLWELAASQGARSMCIAIS